MIAILFRTAKKTNNIKHINQRNNGIFGEDIKGPSLGIIILSAPLIKVSVLISYAQLEEIAGCLVFIVLQMYCYYKCSVAFLTVPWVGLQCVIVVFSDHTHLCFKKNVQVSLINTHPDV